MKSLNNNFTNFDANLTGDVVWNGPDIPFLKIKIGDNLNCLIAIIADKLISVLKPVDLDTLNIKCALDIIKKEEPSQRSLINILQLLLDNNCHLNELVVDLQKIVDGISKTTITLDLKCLDPDGLLAEAGYTEKIILQKLIIEICKDKENIHSIAESLSQLKSDFEAFIKKPVAIVEKEIDTCLNKKGTVSSHVIAHATDYCKYKEIVGNGSSVAEFIAGQPEMFKTLLIDTPGYIQEPKSAMELLSNYNLAFSNLFERLNLIEINCCAVTCDDILIGFSILTGEEDANEISIIFNNGNGTKIPNGIVDKGSKITFTDIDGNVMQFPIEIANNVTKGPFDIYGLNTKEDITVSIQAVMGTENGSLVCQKCLPSKKFRVKNACKFCVIENISTSENPEEGKATIVYRIIKNN